MTPKQIKMARVYMGLDQRGFGKVFGVSNKMVWRWEQPIDAKNHSPMAGEYAEKLKRILEKYKEVHGEITW